VEWGPGNINADPKFANASNRDYHLSANSPCIDAGGYPGIVITTNTFFESTNRRLFSVTNDLNNIIIDDFDRLSRPLDGFGKGAARFDIGAYEFINPVADSNKDGIPDGWCHQFGFNPTISSIALIDADYDGMNNGQEYIADTNPTNALSNFRLELTSEGERRSVSFVSSVNRQYSLYYATSLVNGVWATVPGQTGISGNGGLMVLSDANRASPCFYRVSVDMP
jgi:hypothetical protein